MKALAKSFELDESLRKEIIEIKDDYAVGPLWNVLEKDGLEARKDWWRNVLAEGDYAGTVDQGVVNDQKALSDIKQYLETEAEESVWIWVAPNNHDVTGYYWLVGQLREYAGRVFVLHLNNLPFINEKGALFYPGKLSEIPPREFIKAQKLARPVTLSEFELDEEEWQKIAASDKGVRVLEGAKKLSLHEINYYDKFILEFITKDWQKAFKVINVFLNKSKKITGDAFILWRIKRLIEMEKIEARGPIKNMKDFEVKQLNSSLEPEQ